MPYSLAEPFPSVPRQPTYIRTGRGGAGNKQKVSASTIAARNNSNPAATLDAAASAAAAKTTSSSASSTTSTASTASTSSSRRFPSLTSKPKPATTKSAGRYLSGRGGAGNVQPASERALFSFDEELERLDRCAGRGIAPVYHIGRGGAGNARRLGDDSDESSGDEDEESRSDGRAPRAGSLEWVRERIARSASRS